MRHGIILGLIAIVIVLAGTTFYLFSYHTFERSAEFDLSAKCADEAKKIFGERLALPSDRATIDTTIRHDYTSHYRKADNKCYMMVTDNYWQIPENNPLGADPLVTKSVSLYDVLDFIQIAWLAVNVSEKNPDSPALIECDINGKKCSSENEFLNAVRTYMTD